MIAAINQRKNRKYENLWKLWSYNSTSYHSETVVIISAAPVIFQKAQDFPKQSRDLLQKSRDPKLISLGLP